MTFWGMTLAMRPSEAMGEGVYEVTPGGRGRRSTGRRMRSDSACTGVNVERLPVVVAAEEEDEDVVLPGSGHERASRDGGEYDPFELD